MTPRRGEFSSQFGFVMAASGSAVGLGNIWGFPTQAASNGGAAFLLVYLVLAFILAYPVLMAEIIIGRHAHSNAVTALRNISSNQIAARLGALTGIAGIIVASLILSFYAIVAGWMIAFFLSGIAHLSGMNGLANWLTASGLWRNLIFTAVFMSLTIAIVTGGVREGIERWSGRLMPALLITLLVLVFYVLTLDGAAAGLKVYLWPDFSRALERGLIIDALGSAFFSLSLGVGTMLIYGSYLSDDKNLPMLGGIVTLVDILIAVLAGFLVLPAMYVALKSGVDIFGPNGTLLSEDTLIFVVLPELFKTMGETGVLVSIMFFFLMTIAALTSSISMLEVPVAYAVEALDATRRPASIIIGIVIACFSAVILCNFDDLFGLVVTLTTRYSQPLLGFVFCIYVGWIWQRNTLLQELRKGYYNVGDSWFWRIWPWYVQLVCPLIITAIFLQSILN
ncbi:MAG: sodium-dependent transporter [Halioglobus sp.]